MSDDNHGMSSADLFSRGLTGGGNVHSSSNIPNGGGGDMLPVGKASIDLGTPSVDTSLSALSKNLDEAFAALSSGSEALGASVTGYVNTLIDFCVTKQANGDPLDLKGIGPQEIANHGFGPQNDFNLQKVGLIGSNGQSAGQ